MLCVMLMLVKQTGFMKREKIILVPDRTFGRLTFANLSKLSAILHLHISLPALTNYQVRSTVRTNLNHYV
jgi:hypothetical protein